MNNFRNLVLIPLFYLLVLPNAWAQQKGKLSMWYDKHGNILTMIRYGKQNSGYGLIDSLTLTYNGNQLKKVN